MKKIIMIGAVLFCSAVSYGAVILQEDFETGINGQSFPDWAWPSEQLITDNGINGKSLMIYRDNPSLGNSGVHSPAFTPTFGLIEFDLMIDTPCVYTSDSPGTNPEGAVFLSDGSIIAGTPAGIVPTSGTWTAGQAFRFGVLSLADEFFVYINDTEIVNVQRSIQYSNMLVESFYFSYGANDIVSPGTIMIDNVLVTPEPATLLLFSLGAALIRKRKM